MRTLACLEAKALLASGVGDGEEGEEVAADAEEDVQRVEDDGDARRAVGILSQKLIAVHTVLSPSIINSVQTPCICSKLASR